MEDRCPHRSGRAATPVLLASAATAAARAVGLQRDRLAEPVRRTSGGAAYQLTAQTPAPKGDIDSFTWSIYAEPLSLDYAYAFDYPPNQVLANVCESLLRWNADLSASPGLAAEYANPTPTTLGLHHPPGRHLPRRHAADGGRRGGLAEAPPRPGRRLVLGERLPAT